MKLVCCGLIINTFLLCHCFAESGQFKLKDHIEYKFGGRLMLDGAYYGQDKQDIRHGTEVRRARLYFAGNLEKNWDFIIQNDFAGNSSSLKAAHIGYSYEDSKITLGNQLPAFSLQLQTSSKWQTFTTRSTPVLTFNPDNSFGISYRTTSNNWFFKTGAYGDTASSTVGKERFIHSTRIAKSIELGESINHFGIGYMYTKDEENKALKSSSETHVSNYSYINTDEFTDLATERYGVEYALVYHSFSFQTEYMKMEVRPEGVENSSIDGWYVFMSYFLTGESRNYSKSSATFGEITPNRKLSETGGNGAFECALRVSALNMEADELGGGKQDNFGGELNWYPGGGLKFMLNHTIVNAEKDGLSDKPSITQFRAQITF